MAEPDPTRSFYDRIARVYDLVADASEHAARQRGIDLLAPAGSERVLEIGCGTGHGVVEIAERLADEGRVHGLDLSPGMLEVARRRIAASGLGHRIAEARESDARDLPYPAGHFDAAFASFTLELFPAPEIPVVLGELARVLAPGGRLGVVAMLDDGGHGPMVELYGFLHRHFPHIVDCRPIDVHGALAAAGYRVRQGSELAIWGLPVIALVAGAPDASWSGIA